MKHKNEETKLEKSRVFNLTTTFTMQRFSTYVFRDVSIAPFKFKGKFHQMSSNVRLLAHQEFVDISHRVEMLTQAAI